MIRSRSIHRRKPVKYRKTVLNMMVFLSFLAMLSTANLAHTLAEELPFYPDSMNLEKNTDIQIKAAFVHHVAKFVQWPAETFVDQKEPFVLYVLGGDRFISALDPFDGRMVHNRTLSVAKISTYEDIPYDCRILLVDVSEKEEISKVLDKVAGRPILTVSDQTGFAEAGGIIGLVAANKRIHFVVNQSAATEAGLVVSSNVMKLALSIYGEAQ